MLMWLLMFGHSRTEMRCSVSVYLFPVELPGIEPSAEIALTWGNSRIDDAKARNTTCGYATGVDDINNITATRGV